MVDGGPSPDVGYQEIKMWAYTQENELIQSHRSERFLTNPKYGRYPAIKNVAESGYYRNNSESWSGPEFTYIGYSIICGYKFRDSGLTRCFPTKFENDPKKRVKLIRANKKVIVDKFIDHFSGESVTNYNTTRYALGSKLADVMEELLVNNHYTNIIKLNTHINKLFIQEVIPCYDDVEKLTDNIVLGVVENPILAVAEMRKKWFNHFSTIFDPYKKGGELRYIKGQELRLCNNLKQKD